MSNRTFRHARVPAALLALLLIAGLPVAASPAPAARVIDANLAAPMHETPAEVPVVIRFRSAPGAAEARLLRSAGFAGPMIRYTIIPAVSVTGSAAAIRTIAADPRVAYIEHDAAIPYTLDRATQAGRATPVWSATYADASGVHTGGITGRGVGIAIVDSGIDATHADLLWEPVAIAGRQAKTVANYKMVGRDSAELIENLGAGDFVEANTLAIDMADTDTTSGHGTHVAGIAASLGTSSDGTYKGAAPGANLIGFGAGETLLVTTGLAAFDYIHRHHDDPELNIRVVNNSWGGPGDYNLDRAVSKAALQLVDDGLVVVFSAGNDGGDGSNIATSVWANLPSDGIISVANYYDGTGWLDSSSSRGRKTLEHTWPDIAAPGTEIISTAATAGPVTYFGTAQDALIAEFEGYDEPVVASLPAATPVTVEQDGVVAGPYASFTGTSMSSPFVAGVVALILEANPSLTPAEVRRILRETATMPPGRTVADDGFAIGRGVVDAAEAVAVALRATSVPLDEALRTAYANLDASPAELNLGSPRRLRIDSPGADAPVSGSVTVEGEFLAGPVTDQSIPLFPEGGPLNPVSGNPRIYQGGADPFILGGHHVPAGTTVGLSVRTITSSDANVSVAVSNVASASHRITRDGGTVYGPFDATVAADTANTRTDVSWDVPPDAAAGEYVFEGTITLSNGQSYATGSLPFTIVTPPVAVGSARVEGLDGPAAVASSSPGPDVFFADGFETHTTSDTRGWTIENNGLAHGLLTEWALFDETTELSWAGPGAGERAYAANLWISSPTLSGLMYTDLADTDLISPVIDLTAAQTAELSYMHAGQSENGYDFMRAFVTIEGSGTWTEVGEHTGDLVTGGESLDWGTTLVDLNAFAGSRIRVRFSFTSDEYSVSGNLTGWQVDEVRVTGTQGTGEVVITPSLTASTTSGIGSLDTILSFDATAGGTPIDQYTLDFGDGSPVQTRTEAGSIAHTYSPGIHTATLTVEAAGETETAMLTVDVMPVNVVQVRIAGGAWSDAAVASTADVPFSVVLDLAGVPAGPALIEVRHAGEDGVVITDTRSVTVV